MGRLERKISKALCLICRKACRFNYKLDAQRRMLKATVVSPSEYHPLKPITVTDAARLKVSEKDGKSESGKARTTIER